MDEFEIIRRWFTPEEKSECVIVGVGDDGADASPTATVTAQQIQIQVTSPTAPLETILLIGLLLP